MENRKTVRISDATLCREESALSFKGKLEIARQLERLRVDEIQLPRVTNAREDTLLIRTVASFVKESVLSVCADTTPGSVANAAAALAGVARPRIRIEIPLSPVGMEYTCHLKPAKLLTRIGEVVGEAKTQVPDVEFCAVDATRAEPAFLADALRAAADAGATGITLCDSAAGMFPDDFAAFVKEICETTALPVTVCCDDQNGMACADALLAVRAGADGVVTAVDGTVTPIETLLSAIRNCGETYGISTGVRQTELERIIKQIRWIRDASGDEKKPVVGTTAEEESIRLDRAATAEEIAALVLRLGYELSAEDQTRVYEGFLRVAEKKTVGTKELEAIVASVALQVPATYRLQSYVINNGNIISSTAQVTLEREGKALQGICIGDGPVDAAFRAMEQIIGRHYELDDFQIQSVTEGKEAVGSALVRLRSDGKLYSGNGISTDIIGAAIRAYLNAVNKIVYEEDRS